MISLKKVTFFLAIGAISHVVAESPDVTAEKAADARHIIPSAAERERQMNKVIELLRNANLKDGTQITPDQAVPIALQARELLGIDPIDDKKIEELCIRWFVQDIIMKETQSGLDPTAFFWRMALSPNITDIRGQFQATMVPDARQAIKSGTIAINQTSMVEKSNKLAGPLSNTPASEISVNGVPCALLLSKDDVKGRVEATLELRRKELHDDNQAN